MASVKNMSWEVFPRLSCETIFVRLVLFCHEVFDGFTAEPIWAWSFLSGKILIMNLTSSVYM